MTWVPLAGMQRLIMKQTSTSCRKWDVCMFSTIIYSCVNKISGKSYNGLPGAKRIRSMRILHCNRSFSWLRFLVSVLTKASIISYVYSDDKTMRFLNILYDLEADHINRLSRTRSCSKQWRKTIGSAVDSAHTSPFLSGRNKHSHFQTKIADTGHVQ